MGEAFTRNFKALREDKGLKQYQLAEACGLRDGTVSAWETQQTQPRSPKVIKILCDFFDCSESDLFGYSDGYYAKTRGISSQVAIKSISSQTSLLQDGQSILVPEHIVLRYPNGFMLQLIDDSMMHIIPRNSYVYANKTAVVSTGNIVVLRLDTEILCRKITVYDEVYILDACTCDVQYQRRLIDRKNPPKNFEILGKVVWMEKEF